MFIELFSLYYLCAENVPRTLSAFSIIWWRCSHYFTPKGDETLHRQPPLPPYEVDRICDWRQNPHDGWLLSTGTCYWKTVRIWNSPPPGMERQQDRTFLWNFRKYPFVGHLSVLPLPPSASLSHQHSPKPISKAQHMCPHRPTSKGLALPFNMPRMSYWLCMCN